MVNNLDFAERLKTVMSFYNLTATALADSINIQRSSISHLLSGRNRPSLDFVLKVLQEYPDVELYWLMNGKGQFPKVKEDTLISSPPTPSNIATERKQTLIDHFEKKDDEIEKIVVFYKNGTFKSYTP